MKETSEIYISLDSIQLNLKVWIYSKQKGTLFDFGEYGHESDETRFQLLEGCSYDYEFNDPNFHFGDIGENIIQPHTKKTYLGVIAPNIFVGTLQIPVKHKHSNDCKAVIELEIRSIKMDYKKEYRFMLEYITEKCTELIIHSNSPVSQKFETDYRRESKSLYQRFAFLKSIVNSEEFKDAINRIIQSPKTNWFKKVEEADIRRTRKFDNRAAKSLITGSTRREIPKDHYLNKYIQGSIPEKILTWKNIDSVDTPENRFIKHVLITFLKFSEDINKTADNNTSLFRESLDLTKEISNNLQSPLFKKVSKPTTLKINSPTLQRKEGYREVLRAWLTFDLASKLTWEGGEDVYNAGKKDIATLYEYWLFFKLLELFKEIFKIGEKELSELIKSTDDGLNLNLKQGNFTALRGVYTAGKNKLNIKFNYNRTFSGNKKYPYPGSWSLSFRPDYTLSFWPFEMKENEAELNESIMHIHFDAKYKIARLADLIESKADSKNHQENNTTSTYKHADLIKMHAYKDAIRRTGGAYILYPGDKSVIKKGFHEIIPGLGAFSIVPTSADDGIEELKKFILEVVKHFNDESSNRAKVAELTHQLYKSVRQTR